jgi:hypothetical protein
MKAYHGTTVNKAKTLARRIENNDLSFPGLYVTNTIERATRYANAQATGKVTGAGNYSSLVTHAAVLVLEVPDTAWLVRENPASLDEVEACVQTAKVINIHQHLCEYRFCRACHPENCEEF